MLARNPLNVGMRGVAEPEDLVEHLARTSRLERDEAVRVVQEVLAYFSESTPQFVARRHADLRREGLTNAAIFERIAREVETRRFSAPPLSERQIRRLVHG